MEVLKQKFWLLHYLLKWSHLTMNCPLRINSEGNALDCYKNECAWWVTEAEITESDASVAWEVLEVAVNGIFVTIGDEGEEYYE